MDVYIAQRRGEDKDAASNKARPSFPLRNFIRIRIYALRNQLTLLRYFLSFSFKKLYVLDWGDERIQFQAQHSG